MTMLLCVVRLLMAVLLKHTDLGHVVLGLMEHSQGETPHKPTLPRSVLDICRAIHAAKKGLIKVGMPLHLSTMQLECLCYWGWMGRWGTSAFLAFLDCSRWEGGEGLQLLFPMSLS